jgi:hypothetical protein
MGSLKERPSREADDSHPQPHRTILLLLHVPQYIILGLLPQTKKKTNHRKSLTVKPILFQLSRPRTCAPNQIHRPPPRPDLPRNPPPLETRLLALLPQRIPSNDPRKTSPRLAHALRPSPPLPPNNSPAAALPSPLIQPEGEVLPHSYSVHLHPGYSMEAHKLFVLFVGAAGDLQRHVAFEYRHELGYRAEGLDEAMLRAVRADVGVDWVEMGCMVGGADPNEGDYDEFQRKLDVAMLLEELLGPEWEDEVPSCPGLFADLRVKKLHSLFFLVFARMVKLPLPEEPIRSRASPSHSVPGMPDGSKN